MIQARRSTTVTAANATGLKGEAGRVPASCRSSGTTNSTRDMIRNSGCDMPPIPASQVSDAEVAQIVAYLKTIE